MARVTTPTPDPVDVRPQFRGMARWQFGLVAIAVVALGAHDPVKDGLVAAGWSRWWVVLAELPLFLVLSWRSILNHRCPACGVTLRTLIGLRACPACGARFR